MYRLRIYGLPRVDDEEWDGEAEAIESARRHLAVGKYHCELREKMTSRVVWSAYIENGAIVEYRRDREPGSD